MSGNSKKLVLGSPKTAIELLEIYYLDARSQMLETAAILDRIERAPGGGEVLDDLRIRKLLKACDIIKNGGGNRAEQFLLLLSDPVEGGDRR